MGAATRRADAEGAEGEGADAERARAQRQADAGAASPHGGDASPDAPSAQVPCSPEEQRPSRGGIARACMRSECALRRRRPVRSDTLLAFASAALHPRGALYRPLPRRHVPRRTPELPPPLSSIRGPAHEEGDMLDAIERIDPLHEAGIGRSLHQSHALPPRTRARRSLSSDAHALDAASCAQSGAAACPQGGPDRIFDDALDAVVGSSRPLSATSPSSAALGGRSTVPQADRDAAPPERRVHFAGAAGAIIAPPACDDGGDAAVDMLGSILSAADAAGLAEELSTG